jgi:hypothetical protein
MIDPLTGMHENLLRPKDEASVFFALTSNRGDKTALHYNGAMTKGISGLAVIVLPERSLRIVFDSPDQIRPIGWSADDGIIYAINRRSGDLLEIRSDGSSWRRIGKLPVPTSYGHAVEVGHLLKLVVSIPEDREDVWVIDNFDSGK